MDKCYIVLDESGSYSNIKERYFVIAGYFTDDLVKVRSLHKTCEKQLKFLAGIDLKADYELKASKMKPIQKAYMINELFEKNNIYPIAIVIDKEKYSGTGHQNICYNFFVKVLTNYILTYMRDNPILKKAEMISYKLDNRSVSVGHLKQLEDYIESEFPGHEVDVTYLDSKKYREIQEADYIANMIWGYYNHKKSDKTQRLIKKYHRIKLSKFPYREFGK